MSTVHGPGPRVWLLRAAAMAAALVALFHLSATIDFTSTVHAATLPAEYEALANVLWHYGSVSLVATTLGLAWVLRLPAAAARPLALFIAAQLTGLTLVFAAVGLATFGPSGLLVLPHWLFGVVIVSLILGGLPKSGADASRATTEPPVSGQPILQ